MMKKLIIATAVVALFGAGIANATVDLDLGNTGDIELTGTIAKKCVLDLSKFNGQAKNLDLGSDQSQAGPSIRTWCNTEVAPSISFTSANEGMKNQDSTKEEIIKYTAWMDGFGALDLSGTPQVMPLKEYGKGMDYHQRPIRYTAQPNGHELAGNYADTITIELLPQ
jgi:hypothetical protein